MEGMRTLLIVIGLIFILGLLAHGLWTIRKNNRVQQQRQARREAAQRRIDESGFDEYGIGKVRTVQRTESSREQPGLAKAAPAKVQVTETGLDANAAPQSKVDVKSTDTAERPVTAAKEQTLSDTIKEEPVAVKSPSPQPKTLRKEPTVHVEQLPMDFDMAEDEPHVSEFEAVTTEASEEPELGHFEASADIDESVTETQDPAAKAPEQEVITLFVSGDIQGAILLQTVTELGFKFGEMDIFHRHEDTSGKGPILFSMANMFNPGVFELDEIETFSTRGVALFMALPLKSDGHKAFTMMYNAANKIAEAMPRAAVLDGNRNPITKQSVQHTYQKIREFERRQHVAGKHH